MYDTVVYVHDTTITIDILISNATAKHIDNNGCMYINGRSFTYPIYVDAFTSRDTPTFFGTAPKTSMTYHTAHY